MNVTAFGWRLTVAYSRRSLAVSVWHHDELRAGAGGLVIARGNYHLFADWGHRTWAYFSDMGRVS